MIVEEGDELPIEDSDVDGLVLNPQGDDSSDDMHYNSVGIALEFGEFRYVTTGDAEDDAENDMVSERESDLESDVYQAGHHGSSTSSTPAFMDAVDPDIAVVSSDYDSQYGHPDEEVLERYAEMGIETYWTGVHGDIVVTTDGDGAIVETSDAFSTDPEALLEEKPDDDSDANSISHQSPVIKGVGSPVSG